MNFLADMPNPEPRFDTWDPSVTYVIGHQRPDTDAIASALGFAWFMSQTGHERVTAARAGQPGPQTSFALRRFGLAPPPLLAEASPTFGHVARPIPTVRPETSISDALPLLALGSRLAPVVDVQGQPLGALTPVGLAKALTDGPKALSRACGELAEQLPSFESHERLSDHRTRIVRQELDEFLVRDHSGLYLGIATRSRVLDPPRARLVLVDHNELSQAVAGAEEADIIGVLDHHRLGNAPTAAPIRFVVEPVGSSSTLVAEHCRGHDLDPPADIAGMLLSGLLSDTLVLRSPTTTARDHEIAYWLAQLAGVELEVYGEELLHSSPGLGSRPAADILEADRKIYQIGSKNVSIAQVEVTSMQELPERREDLVVALEERREREGLALACLLVTDVVTGRSRLLCRGESPILAALPFSEIDEGVFDLGEIVSRKKQLVPALYDVLQETP